MSLTVVRLMLDVGRFSVCICKYTQEYSLIWSEFSFGVSHPHRLDLMADGQGFLSAHISAVITLRESGVELAQGVCVIVVIIVNSVSV